MSSISPPGQTMVFKPVRRNSTVKRPLPVVPPVAPFPVSRLTPLLHQDGCGIPRLNRNCEKAPPCAKITVDGIQDPQLTSHYGDRKSSQRSNAINSLQPSNANNLKPYNNSTSPRYSSEDNKCKVNVTNSSVVILNHFDESKINPSEYLSQKRKKFRKGPRKKSEETRLLQVLTKYQEESPRLSAASIIFWKFRNSQASNYSKFCDFGKSNANSQGCDEGIDPHFVQSSSSTYEIQELSLWLSDDGYYATENVFCSSLGIQYHYNT